MNDIVMPTQSQLMLPLLEEIKASGGRARPRDVYDRVAERLGIPSETRSATATYKGDRDTNLFERKVRWTRQSALLRGYIRSPSRSLWELTDAGSKALQNVRPGIIVTVFETALGAALWATAEDASALIENNSIDLIFSSPPYPTIKPFEYGTIPADDWVEWMISLARRWHDKLTPSGSLILNIGPTWEPGRPTRSPYIERLTLRLIDDLGYHLADRLYWQNPAKMPPPAWVALRRIRVKPTVEPLLWMSRSPFPKSDVNRVLLPYASRTRAQYLGKKRPQRERRPSGYTIAKDGFSRDNGGSIPPALITAAASSNDTYRRACRATGLRQHPAVMPQSVAEFAVNLTTEPGDLVYDPFLGSGTTAAAAEALGRRWIGSERSRHYLTGAAFRFEDSPGFARHL